ncbi:cytochrome-c peroxidase [Aquimarina sp. D1M17]|uniref:cytochrome-c peroxidase n=1 Tax=Aquimarina acroporae TaxID=2937283 RepID=UPI0020C0768F|nr:cytochrome-c peroxidase [Aquimarina acroporae]MCK8521241.1 cytochrome-c peroxidase [Aquimarina acroporae]
MKLKNLVFAIPLVVLASCSEDEDYVDVSGDVVNSLVLEQMFGNNIDLDNLANYANQNIPDYITRDNTGDNTITDAKATLGRVLFYDKNLSVDNTIACASCHQQAFAFGDKDNVSEGVNGVTGRHSMRLINSRFARETRFFWDERANSLEEQTTQPIQDHAEMGFSGQDGAPDLSNLLNKLSELDYYQELFQFVYGDSSITEDRLQETMAQFIRSIQSFDAKYDTGRAMVQNDNLPFPNFTEQENEGKELFFRPAIQNGAGCISCHTAPEFDIDPESLNNGVTGVFGNAIASDFLVTRAPTLRDIFNYEGEINGPLMHDASMATVTDALEHYNNIDATGNTNLDNRLRGGVGANGQNLNLNEEQILALEAFIKTLSGTNVYIDPKWSDPFAI